MRIVFVLALALQARAARAACAPEVQVKRSAELAKMADEDQADRQGPIDAINWDVVTPRDVARRKRAGEIAAEGCLASAQDYANAALFYQHGDTTDDYFRAFTYFKKSVELGDASQKVMLAKGADRYIVSLGYKQLYGTQASKPSMDPKDCFCLEPVCEAMTAQQRALYAERTLEESFKWVDSLNAQEPRPCPPARFCKKDLKDPPKGTLPGLW